MTLIQADGTRFFTHPIDARTGRSFSSKDTYSAGYFGDIPICADLPDDFDASREFSIESYSLYEPAHHLWLLPFRLPVIHVPAVLGGSQ